jgi:FAD:protein FMN transferase
VVTPARTPVAVGKTRVEQIMGMPIVIDGRDCEADEDLEPLFEWLRRVDRTFSTYRPDSEISRIARGELRSRDAGELVREVLARCEELRASTGGYFDARVARAGKLDPSGLVKGWAVQRAASLADELGWRNYAINAGGDIRLRGGALPAERWRVGIQHPDHPREIATVVVGDDLAIATSGAYLRGEHIVDPHTERPPRGVLSITLTGADLGTVDAFATAASAMGEDGPAWAASQPGIEVLALMSDGSSLRSHGFPAEEPRAGAS